MKKRTGIVKGLCAAVLGLALTCARVAGAYTQPPSVPASSTGSYTVSWANQCWSDCIYMWLEEKVGSGDYVYVAASSPLVFNTRPAGDYSYRLARVTTSSMYFFDVEYSPEVVVRVSPNAPAADPLITQRGYQYRTRVGDIDFDGRRDLLVERVSGGVVNNGVLDKVILQQTATPGQYALVAPTAAQSAAASYWPVSSAQVAVEDINVDGFVDVTVKGVASALGTPGARNLIVFSPGQAGSSVPKGMRVIDDGLLRFAGNMLDYEVDQNYFVNNATWSYFYVGSLYSTCSDGLMFTSDPIYGASMPGCIWVYQYTTGYYPDYSRFSTAAVSISQAAEDSDARRISTTAAVDTIDNAAEGVLGTRIGGWNMEEALGAAGEHTNADSRRAMEVFWAILGIGRADAEEVVTEKAPKQTARALGTVYITGHRIFAFGPVHTAIEYTSAYLPTTTISAGPEGSLPYLVSRLNRPTDTPALNMVLGTVSDPGNPSSEAYFGELLQADANYDDDLWYDALVVIPSAYNSNSYVRGIVDATGGIPTVNLGAFLGGNKAVPASKFW